MKVKIGDTIYDSEQEPILLILTPQERLDIIGLPPSVYRYVVAPEGINLRTSSLLRQWLTDSPGPVEFFTNVQIEGEG